MFNKEKLIAGIVSIILFTSGYFFIQNNNQYVEDQIDELSNEIVRSQAVVIERSVQRSTSSAVILGNHIHALNGNMYDFEEYAQDLYFLLGGVTNLQLAPNGVIAKIYPLKGHEKALGHDIFNADSRKKEAFLAKKSKKLTLAGPFTLIQGGVAIIARNPVYLDDNHLEKNHTHKHSHADKFWGFTSSLIMLDDLLKNTDVHLLEEKNYLYRLWRHHPDTNKVDIFAGVRGLPNIKVLTKSISVPNGKWFLDIEYVGTSVSSNAIKIFYTINFLVSILLGYLLYVLLNRPKELKREVSEKTHELKKLTNAVTYNSTAIFIANKDGVVEYINPAFEEMTGYSFDDIYNDETDLFQEELSHAIKEKNKWSGQGTHIKKNQEKFVSITTISLVTDYDNNITSYVGVCEDITQKLKDEEIIHDKEILLLQQSKMASIGEMFENIAHQWMQPLSGVLTMATGLKMLKEGDALPDKVLLEHLDNISLNVNHLTDTVNDFRNFFRQDKTIKEFYLNDAFNKALSLLTSELKTSGIKIILSEEDIKVTGIANELIQVFMNIITNAKQELLKIRSKKYIFIDTKIVDENVLIEITDSAGGVPVLIIDKIFDSHFTTKNENGTGIGLYMSQKIIEENMKGILKVENTIYEYKEESFAGAKFSIILPLKL